MGLGAAGVIAVVAVPAVAVAVVIPVPVVVPAAVVIPVVAVVVVPLGGRVLAQHLGLHLVLADRDVTAVAGGLDARLRLVGRQHQVGGAAADGRVVGVEQGQRALGLGGQRVDQAVLDLRGEAGALVVGLGQVTEVVGLVAGVGAGQVQLGLDAGDVVGQLDQVGPAGQVARLVGQRGEVGGDRGDARLGLAAPGLQLIHPKFMVAHAGQARALLHLDALDAGRRQVDQGDGQRVGLDHRRLRIDGFRAGQQIDVAGVEALHGHGLRLGGAGGQVDQEVARLDQRVGLLAPQHHGHALLGDQRQVLEQVERLLLLGHIDLAVVVEAQAGHGDLGGAGRRHQAAGEVQRLRDGVLGKVLQAGGRVALDVVEVRALQLLAVAEDDLLFHRFRLS